MSLPVMFSRSAVSMDPRRIQYANIAEAEAVSGLVRTCLGPSAMLKMLIDPMGGLVLTSDGNSILREIETNHPIAKEMIEISKTQDEECGDGTTTVVILSGELLHNCISILERGVHPLKIVSGLQNVLEDALLIMEKSSIPIDIKDTSLLKRVILSTISTQFDEEVSDHLCNMALKAIEIVSKGGDIDIKKYARIEKVVGGEILESTLISGIVINKDITHPKMRRKIKNPRVILLDCALEYKKGESQTSLEITEVGGWKRMLEIEEEQVKDLCNHIISVKPDVVLCEKGVSDLAQQYLVDANITVLRRVKKMDNVRAARATGANIVSIVSDMKEADVGKKCELFEIRKLGDEYYTYLEMCKDSSACTLLLRGSSKEMINDVERYVNDLMYSIRNLHIDPRVVAGGGAIEMKISAMLERKVIESSVLCPDAYKCLSSSLEVIPNTLILNGGGNPVRVMTQLREKNLSGAFTWGVDGMTGEIKNTVDLKTGTWESLTMKKHILKLAVEFSCMILRIDDIVAVTSKKASNDRQ